jgi:16S rRNA (guanine966-N2)-methyltransferase
VVAGELGGRRLATPGRGADVRPTSDKVREAIFSILGDVEGARVLDLFTGTGALAIEALSRGAASAVLVDTEIRLASRNVADLGLEDRCELLRVDAQRYLRRAERQFDLLLCDPPYRLADRLEADLATFIPPRLARGGRAVIESAASRPIELALPLIRERTYGDTSVRVYASAG